MDSELRETVLPLHRWQAWKLAHTSCSSIYVAKVTLTPSAPAISLAGIYSSEVKSERGDVVYRASDSFVELKIISA